MNHVTNEFNNSNLSRTSFQEAKPLLICLAVITIGLIAAFCAHY